MAEFEGNELRDEERLGSFNPGTPDDETFYLETIDSYPGELPDYSNLEDAEKISLEEQLDLNGKDAEVEEMPQVAESVVIPQETLLDEVAETDDSIVNLSVLEDSYEDAKEIEEPVDNSNSVWDLFEENKSDSSATTAVLGEQPEEEEMISDDELEKKLVTEPAPAQPKQEDITLDDDFKQMIEFDLQKKKREPKKQPEPTNITDDTSDFHPVEEESGFNEFDLSKLSAEHPSTFRPEEEKIADPFEEKEEPVIDFLPTKEPEIVFIDEEQKKQEKVRKEKPKKEKSEKSKKKYIFFAAALLAFVAFGAVTYDWGVNRGGFADYLGIGKKFHPEIAKKEHKTETTKHFDNEQKNDKEKKQVAIAEEKPKPDTIIIIDTVEKPIIVEKPKHVSLDRPVVISHRPTKHKPNPAYPVPKKVQPVNQEYTVQVYATPSKEDAEDWVKQLQSRNVKNVFISVQKKRDKDWYRVRFGSFNSMDEAKIAVKEMGLSQSWIDRVK